MNLEDDSNKPEFKSLFKFGLLKHGTRPKGKSPKSGKKYKFRLFDFMNPKIENPKGRDKDGNKTDEIRYKYINFEAECLEDYTSEEGIPLSNYNQQFAHNGFMIAYVKYKSIHQDFKKDILEVKQKDVTVEIICERVTEKEFKFHEIKITASSKRKTGITEFFPDSHSSPEGEEIIGEDSDDI